MSGTTHDVTLELVLGQNQMFELLELGKFHWNLPFGRKKRAVTSEIEKLYVWTYNFKAAPVNSFLLKNNCFSC